MEIVSLRFYSCLFCDKEHMDSFTQVARISSFSSNRNSL